MYLCKKITTSDSRQSHVRSKSQCSPRKIIFYRECADNDKLSYCLDSNDVLSRDLIIKSLIADSKQQSNYISEIHQQLFDIVNKHDELIYNIYQLNSEIESNKLSIKLYNEKIDFLQGQLNTQDNTYEEKTGEKSDYTSYLESVIICYEEKQHTSMGELNKVKDIYDSDKQNLLDRIKMLERELEITRYERDSTINECTKIKSQLKELKNAYNVSLEDNEAISKIIGDKSTQLNELKWKNLFLRKKLDSTSVVENNDSLLDRIKLLSATIDELKIKLYSVTDELDEKQKQKTKNTPFNVSYNSENSYLSPSKLQLQPRTLEDSINSAMNRNIHNQNIINKDFLNKYALTNKRPDESSVTQFRDITEELYNSVNYQNYQLSVQKMLNFYTEEKEKKKEIVPNKFNDLLNQRDDLLNQRDELLKQQSELITNIVQSSRILKKQREAICQLFIKCNSLIVNNHSLRQNTNTLLNKNRKLVELKNRIGQKNTKLTAKLNVPIRKCVVLTQENDRLKYQIDLLEQRLLQSQSQQHLHTKSCPFLRFVKHILLFVKHMIVPQRENKWFNPMKLILGCFELMIDDLRWCFSRIIIICKFMRNTMYHITSHKHFDEKDKCHNLTELYRNESTPHANTIASQSGGAVYQGI